MPRIVPNSHKPVKPYLCGTVPLPIVQNVQRSQQLTAGWLELSLVDGACMFQNRIRAVRKSKRLSLDAVAERMGVDQSTVGRLERSKIKLTDEYLTALADAIGCHPVELLTDVPLASTDAQAEILRTMAGLDEKAVAALLATAKAMAKK